MTDSELRDSSLVVLERRNIVGVASGSPERVREWQLAAPSRVLPGLELFGIGIEVSLDSRRRLVSEGRVRVLAEVASQYRGLGPDHPNLEPYWALAEEFDIPVGIHIHQGPPVRRTWATRRMEAIEIAIRSIEEAPFLTVDQRRAILYDNAARFLRLAEEEMAVIAAGNLRSL